MSPKTRLAAVGLTAGALAVTGCGGGSTNTKGGAATLATAQQPASEQSAKHGPALTRTQLIAKGDAICYRLNARRASTKIERPQDYRRLVPALAAYELVGANEMSNLKPPPTIAHDWRQMITGAHEIARATAMTSTLTTANQKELSAAVEPILYKGITQLTTAAKHAGFKDCTYFP